LRHFLTQKGYAAPFLARSGLFSANHPDFPLFADRLIFPISDAKGRIISFGGRILQGDGPKYINGPETLVFRKQENLFALDLAREAIKRSRDALVCEGYMDAISFHTAGIVHAVAPLGTAFTEKQARLLGKWAQTVVFAFDMDEAGFQATVRALPIAARAGLATKVAQLNGGKDASEILEKEGPESLHKLPDFTINGGEFLLQRARGLFDLGSVEGKSAAVDFLNPFIEALDSEVKRDAFFEMVARQLRIDIRSLRVDFDGKTRPSVRRPKNDINTVEFHQGSDLRRTPDLRFMLAVAMNFDLFQRVRSQVEVQNLEDSMARKLYIALEECFREELTDIGSLLTKIGPGPLQQAVMQAAAVGEFEEQSARLIEDGIRNAMLRGLEKRRESILDHIAEADAERLQDLLSEKMHLDAELAKLKDERDERS
jgi:DNA primase